VSIFCDGACKGNGQKGAVAGWAFAYWPLTVRGEPATSACAPITIATNQRAELMALLESLKYSQGLGSVKIYSDSMYSINCASVWGPAWKRKDWTRGSGEPLQNLDLIKPIVDLYATVKGRVTLQHVKGHQTSASPEAFGNNWVDRLAVEASLGLTRKAIVNTVTLPDSKSSSPKVSLPQIVLGQTDLRKWFT
jgi:ribonuclease HI